MKVRITPEMDREIEESLKINDDGILYKALYHASPDAVSSISTLLNLGKTPNQIARDTKSLWGSTNYARLIGRVARYMRRNGINK